MARFFRSLPFFVVLMFTAAGAMQIPALYGTVTRDFDQARVFFYSGLLLGIAAMLIGIAMQSRGRTETEQGYLLSLLLSYGWMPVILAVPMYEAVGNTRFINAYFDMASAYTTTGADMFEPARLSDTVHLWRGVVGWLGGLLIWISAVAILAPLNLGGYEVTSEAKLPGGMISNAIQMKAASPAERLRKHAARLAPIYVGLTAVLSLALALAGAPPHSATIHAMSTLSTSGISPDGGLKNSPSGVFGEILICLFFVFALSRRSFTSGFGVDVLGKLGRDREVRLAAFAVVVLPTLLFVRHWIGAYEINDVANAGAALTALWGSIFTVLSFLTTTGFISESWAEAQQWSGLPTPGLLLIGLVTMGGGVATTAGGLKLLRVYSLYKHGSREIGKLIHPHSVGGAGRLGRRIRREGAYIAWVFFMLFMVSTAAIMLGLAATGINFENAMVLAVAALSTTGQLPAIAVDTPISYFSLSDAAKMLLTAGMILGRMETLVFIAIFNPAFWRR